VPVAAAFVLDRPTFFDLSRRVKLRVTGSDVDRYLNGQITNDLRKADNTSAIQASILNAKGKFSAHVFISKESDHAFLLDADEELSGDLAVRLERYIIADDVQIEDVTTRFSLFHFLDVSALSTATGGRLIASERFGLPGWDLWAEGLSASELQERLGSDYTFCDDSCAEIFRIERGVPRWGHELTSEFIPVEANLEATSIDYAKGCYIGQEVISRMKMSGQMNKRLCGLISISGQPLTKDTALASEDEPTKEVGILTSATRSVRLGKEIGLGYVKRGHNANGTRLLAGGLPVEIVPLPFI
jgi:folate-binding protein YgfZ